MSTNRNMTPITVVFTYCTVYKLLQYNQQLSHFSGANYPPPSPVPPLVSQYGILITLESE